MESVFRELLTDSKPICMFVILLKYKLLNSYYIVIWMKSELAHHLTGYNKE